MCRVLKERKKVTFLILIKNKLFILIKLIIYLLAVLAKRMKIWERRLMKDFQVAPINNEEDQEEFQPPPENEDALSRFRRIARQAARQTTSYRWGQVMEGVGVITGSTQIGRCRNRQSFKNQQNLQRAMAEAKRYFYIYLN